jgi:hypothetical protein
MMHFLYKWGKKWRFSHLSVAIGHVHNRDRRATVREVTDPGRLATGLGLIAWRGKMILDCVYHDSKSSREIVIPQSKGLDDGGGGGGGDRVE